MKVTNSMKMTDSMKWNRRIGMSIAALSGISLAAVLVTAGCGRGPTVVEKDRQQFPAAIAVYENGCITCHGDNLQGGIGPNLQHVGSRMTLAQIKHRIEVGSGPMPAYTAPGDEILTSAQVDAVAQWLETKK